ncbi:MAG: response regulator [Desulfarculaceae bacterium]|jgi:CheY-like chemotaxis protein
MQPEHLKVLADSAGQVFQEMTDAKVVETVYKREQRLVDRYALALAIPFQRRQSGAKGQLVLGFQDETNAALVASAIAENQNLPPVDGYDATATDLLSNYLSRVMDHCLQAWRAAGFAPSFGSPKTGLDLSMRVNDGLATRPYVVIINLAIGWVVLNFTVKEETAKPLGKKILVVDKSKVIRGLLHNALSGVGCQVVEAKGASDAVKMYSEHDPDLTLIDLFSLEQDRLMPLFQEMRQSGQSKLIVLTEAENGAAPAGMSSLSGVTCLQKPVRMDQLMDMVKQALLG